MQYSPSGVHFLYVAYAAIILGNVAYVGWLVARYRKTGYRAES